MRKFPRLRIFCSERPALGYLRPFLKLLIPAAGYAAALSPLKAQQDGSWARLDSIFSSELRESGAPGGVMALLKGDSIIHVAAIGVRSVEGTDPVTPDTRFRIASATKMLTGLTAADLSVAGVLSLRQPIGRLAKLPRSRLDRVTMGQLLSHTAGLRDASVPPPGQLPGSLRASAAAMGDDLLLSEPGVIYSYSNPGFTLAGYILEAVVKRPYHEVVASRVLQPLGMDASTFAPLEAMTYPLALGHTPADSQGKPPRVVRPFTDDPSLYPRGGLISTAPDMARLLMALMNNGRIKGKAVIPGRSVQVMMTPHGTMPDDTTNHYGLGIRLVRKNGRLEIGHYGGGLGYGAVVLGLPDARTGVVLLTNQNATLLTATADSALAALTPPVQRDQQTPAVRAPLRGPDAKALAGLYRNGPNQEFDLEVVADNLVLIDDGDTLQVMRTGPRTLAALSDGAVAIEWTAVPSPSKPTFLFTLGRAFRREASRPGKISGGSGDN